MIFLTSKYISTLEKYGLNEDITGLKYTYFKPGETMLKEEMPILNLYIVIKGKAKVCASSANGKDLTLSYYVSEGIIGDIELMTNSRVASSSVIAITNFECIAIPYDENLKVLKNNLAFLNHLSQGLAIKLLRSSKDYVSSSLHSAEERLCSYIFENSDDGRFDEKLIDVSNLTGMSYRHLSRLLKKLCNENILVRKNGYYSVVNFEKLYNKSIKS